MEQDGFRQKGTVDRSRRDMLGAAVGVGALAALEGPAAAAGRGSPAPGRALVVSTWDFGAAANAAAYAALKAGRSPVDAVEAGGRVPEADPANHSVGFAGYPDRDGRVTLDAVIMDDAGGLGAVAAMEGVMHAVSVARAVMERTPHTFLVGDGATRFARDQGFPQTAMPTPEAAAAWREWLTTAHYQPVANSENRRDGGIGSAPGSVHNHDTIGILARAANGRMAGACTTSGMAFKMHGRVGDSPQCGAGLFVERGVGGATATGVGEEVTRIAGSARVVASMRAGMAPAAACREAVEHIARLRGAAIKGMQVGFLALSAAGEVGAFALMPGFTYAVTDLAGITRVLPATSLT